MSIADKRSAENTAAVMESANIVAAQTADAVKTAAAQAKDAIEASVDQIRELNEQAIEALESVVEAEKQLAEGSQLDWFSTLVTTQAEFTQRLGAIFLTAARDQLK